jgi:UDPglucose 6-dehydrogenase
MRQLDASVREHSPAVFYYQVETLIFGRAVERAMDPERFIVGATDPTRPLPARFQEWHAAFGCPVLVMRFESAELAKIAINFFLVSTVATTNTLAEVCEAIGADWAEIVPALRLDKRIGPHAYLSPGLGIAGGNLERDLVTVQKIAAARGTEAGVVSAWQTNSRHRRDWALRRIHELVLSKNADPRLAIWGLAYKQDTHSVKNSPALALAQSLPAVDKVAYDPLVKSLVEPMPGLSIAASALEACEGADALAVMTPWSEFSTIDPGLIRKQMRRDVLIDPFAILDGRACRAAGFSYHTLGS